MDTTIFLAQFWGWFSVIIAIVYLVSGKSFLEELLNMHKDRHFLFLSGCLLLPLALMTIILHNVWVADWEFIITIAGWACLFMAITRIGFPKVTEKMLNTAFKDKILHFRIAVVIVGILGFFLIYMSL